MFQDEMSTSENKATVDPITVLTQAMSRGNMAMSSFYLASTLLLVEDPDTSNFFQQKFLELKYEYLKNRPATFVDITDVYGTNLTETESSL